jgi:hypothetical protein
VLALLASLAGLLADGVYGDVASSAEMLRGYDLVTLVLSCPRLCFRSCRQAAARTVAS